MKHKRSPGEEAEILFHRADPATKQCTMNCGPHMKDPRSKAERMFLCDDCEKIKR